jgi:hypothetical protein
MPNLGLKSSVEKPRMKIRGIAFYRENFANVIKVAEYML